MHRVPCFGHEINIEVNRILEISTKQVKLGLENLIFQADRDVLDTLRFLPVAFQASRGNARVWLRDRHAIRLQLESFHHQACETGEGIQFHQWIDEFKKYYGPPMLLQN